MNCPYCKHPMPRHEQYTDWGYIEDEGSYGFSVIECMEAACKCYHTEPTTHFSDEELAESHK